MNFIYYERQGEKVFSYNNNPKAERLFITITEDIKYNFAFLNNVTELMKKVESSNCKELVVSCGSDNINFNKMGMAYLHNTLLFFALKKKNVFVSNELGKLLHEKVSHFSGEKFKKISLKNDLLKSVQQCYCFEGDKDVNRTVQILVDFIAEKSLVLEDAKEFLVTTIGEIFSNAFHHGDKERVFLCTI